MAGQAKPSSSSSGSSPLLKISGERTSLLHEDELTPKNRSESGSFSGDKVTIVSDLSPGILSAVALSDLHSGLQLEARNAAEREIICTFMSSCAKFSRSKGAGKVEVGRWG